MSSSNVSYHRMSYGATSSTQESHATPSTDSVKYCGRTCTHDPKMFGKRICVSCNKILNFNIPSITVRHQSMDISRENHKRSKCYRLISYIGCKHCLDKCLSKPLPSTQCFLGSCAVVAVLGAIITIACLWFVEFPE